MKPWLIMLLVTTIAPRSAMCQDEAASERLSSELHRLDVQSSAGLRRLFQYDGHPMPLLSAHRGGAQPGFPENCLATFENTLRHTFSILEIDLRYAKDGQIVLHHDPTLERTTNGEGRVVDRTVAELRSLRLKDAEGKVTQYRVPTLDEALLWARGKTVVILDKKDVPVEVCVRKIEQHNAQAYAMVMAYSFEDVQQCHDLNADIMMEVMIGNRQRFQEFDKTGVPWSNVVVFVGHTPPQDKELLRMIHAKGACCMAGTSRNLDRQLRAGDAESTASSEQAYRALLQCGVDLIETDLPIQVGGLLHAPPVIPVAKSQFFRAR